MCALQVFNFAGAHHGIGYSYPLCFRRYRDQSADRAFHALSQTAMRRRNTMAPNQVKTMFNALPFRDAVRLHNGLRNPGPLSKDLQDKLRQALRRTNVVIIRDR